jgi:hypothetical protein
VPIISGGGVGAGGFARFDGTIENAVGYAIAGAQVYVCTQPVTTSIVAPVTIPPAPLATIYSDSLGANPITNPVTSDGNGNFFFYIAPGTYTFVFFDPFNRIPTQVFADQSTSAAGGGTVTGVGLTMPAEFTVAGSPINSTGTLAVTKNNQNANLVYAGPGSGPAAAPTFRALVAADLPAGQGTVTSVQETVTLNNPILTGNVSGGPITGAGTLALTLSLANQPANTFIAGPTSGGSAPPTARTLVPADLPGLSAVAFSPTPVFNAGTSSAFTMTLTGNVTSSSVTNAVASQRIAFIITQDATGGRTFVWPPNFKGASAISPDANSVSVQEFLYDGVNFRATGPGLTTGS